MSTIPRLASCLLLLAMLAPATLHVAEKADVERPQLNDEAEQPGVYQFSETELSDARRTLAALTPEQRAMTNHLRYLLRPQFEEAMMTGRAYAPCPISAFEEPGSAIDGAEVARLWAVLASGMPATESTKAWLQLFLKAPVPAGEDSLSEIGLHMGVCVAAIQRPELGFRDALATRAARLLESAQADARATAANSRLIERKEIDPRWFGNHLWRALINRHALDLKLEIDARGWETSLRSLLDAGDRRHGFRSKSRDNSEAEDLDANLIAIAALSLAAAAPEGTLNRSVTRSIEQRLQTVPAVLARLEKDYSSSIRAGTRVAMILCFAPELAPEGSGADSWRTSVAQFAMQLALVDREPSGMVYDGSLGSRELGLAAGRHSVHVSETVMACLALSGGLPGKAAPLAGLSVSEVGRAMHAWAVLHASSLPEGVRRFTRSLVAGGHTLPKAGEMQKFMLKGIEYLVSAQQKDGGWGSAWGGAVRPGAQAAATQDPGSTAFVALALMRAGHKPFEGKHKDAVLKATTYVVDAVEKAGTDGPRITEARGTQLQSKLGDIVDTAVVTQFLARALPEVMLDRKLHGRVEAALDKCIRKIEAAQAADGGWITQGWAPVLQSAMFNQALELALVAGREVDPTVMARSRAYLRGDDVDGRKTEAVKRSTSAGIAFYAGSATLRGTAADTAEVSLVMEQAIKSRLLPARAEVSEQNLRKIGYSDDAAAAKASAYRHHEAMLEKLKDEKYLKGFGNNGGEEFISYMMSSESIVITGNQTWTTWNKKMHDTFAKIQNADGSWTGHHCISSPILCTAAVMLCLTADREVHTLVESGPLDRVTGSTKPAPRSAGKSSGGAVTGGK